MATSCYDSSRVPPLNDIDDVFDAAVSVPDGQLEATAVSGACDDSDGDKFALVWGGDVAGLNLNKYFYCKTVGGAHQLIGPEFVATAWNFDTSPPASGLGLQVPTNVTSGQPLDCPALPTDITALGDGYATSRRRVLQRMGADVNDADLDVADAADAADADAAASPSDSNLRRQLPSSGKECWFVHGSGPDSDQSESTSGFSDYWGTVQNWCVAHACGCGGCGRATRRARWDFLTLCGVAVCVAQGREPVRLGALLPP